LKTVDHGANICKYRDETSPPMIAARPDDPHLPKFLRCVEVGLAWRATIPPEDRFWREN
jgi:hypothetical protein